MQGIKAQVFRSSYLNIRLSKVGWRGTTHRHRTYSTVGRYTSVQGDN